MNQATELVDNSMFIDLDEVAAEADSPDFIIKMSKDLRKAAGMIQAKEARFLVDSYYQAQENRKRAAGQLRAMKETGEPNDAVLFFYNQHEAVEAQLKSSLDLYSRSSPLGQDIRSVLGIGPVVAAGLLAHVKFKLADGSRVRTAGQLWRFAGLDPTSKWEKGQRRPWNAALKRLCWLMGESFVKVSANEKAFYGKLWKERKLQEVERNFNGEFSAQAATILSTRNIGKSTEAYKWYSGCFSVEQAREILSAPTAQGRMSRSNALAGEPGSGLAMLPPAHVHARSKRWVVKIFLAHFHEAGYIYEFGELPPNPYVLDHLGHAHKIVRPFGPEPRS